jgi:glutathione S-transferase
MHSGLSRLRQQLPFNAGRSAPRATHPAAADADIARLKAMLADCRARFGAESGPFLFGAFTVADAMLAPAALRLAMYHIPLDDAPSVKECVRVEGVQRAR